MKKHVFARITSFFNPHYGSKWIRVNDFNLAYKDKNTYTIIDGVFWGPFHLGDIKIEVTTDDGEDATLEEVTKYAHEQEK